MRPVAIRANPVGSFVGKEGSEAVITDQLSALEVVLRVLLALVPATAIGLERELAGQPAGLRTHILLGLGANLFTIAGIGVFGADPSRIAAQVASGVGFLGAGAILRGGAQVRGLTTAAGLWVTAAVGTAAGFGATVPVAVVTVASLAALTAMKWVEDELLPRRIGHVLAVDLSPELSPRDGLDAVTRVLGPMVVRQVEPTADGGNRLVGKVRMMGSWDLVTVAQDLRGVPGVTGVTLQR
jgi:putative Mg2+ transporter-C (MgtC) family protein